MLPAVSVWGQPRKKGDDIALFVFPGFAFFVERSTKAFNHLLQNQVWILHPIGFLNVADKVAPFSNASAS